MKQYIKKLLLFILGIFIVIVLPIIIIGNYDNIDAHTSNNSNIISLQTKSNYENLDILFIGNSYCYSGIQPILLDTIGINSYNLGIATAGVEFYELIINDYLNHVNHYPKSIFILVSPTTFSSKSDNYVDYPIHRYLESPLSNLDIIIKYQHLNQLFPIYRRSFKKGISNIFQLLTDNIYKRNIIRDIDRGFISSNISVTEETINKIKDKYQPLINDKFDFKNISRLEKITQLLKSKDIEVIFFELPTNKLNDYFNNQYISDYEETLKYLSNKNQVIRLDKTLFNNNHFRNIDHLNSSGAKLATEKLIKFLINNKF